ncbi:mCG1051025 [Mus musculus]|nr:mCG1051025 [Mus musculus]
MATWKKTPESPSDPPAQSIPPRALPEAALPTHRQVVGDADARVDRAEATAAQQRAHLVLRLQGLLLFA